MEFLSLKHRPTFMANYLNPALAAGLVEMTQPESPRIPHSTKTQKRVTMKSEKIVEVPRRFSVQLLLA